MHDEFEFYDREKLYREVWENTMIVLGKQYGIPHTALVKVCRDLNIPRPPVGYWTQKECGKAPLRPELPVFENPPKLLIHPPNIQDKANRKIAVGPKRTPKARPQKPLNVEPLVAVHDSVLENPPSKPITVRKAFCWQEYISGKEILFPQAFEEADRLIEKALPLEKAITMLEIAGKEHPYIKKTRKALEKKMTNSGSNTSQYNQGLVHSFGKELFDVNVGPASLPRVLDILKVLSVEFEKQGFSLISEKKEYRQGYNPVCVLIMEQKITFSLTEDTVKTEIKNKNMSQDYEYTPTGILTLQIPSYPFEKHGQFQWSDTGQSHLEERLSEVVTGFILAAAWRREIEARKKQQAREEASKKENERLARIEKQRRINFKKGVDHWFQYREMAAFLEAVKESYGKTVDKNEDTGKWIQWAEKYLSNYQAISEDLIRYDAEEYQEENIRRQSNYNSPSEKPYNYWEKLWYRR
jgi:hypothetical protein